MRDKSRLWSDGGHIWIVKWSAPLRSRVALIVRRGIVRKSVSVQYNEYWAASSLSTLADADWWQMCCTRFADVASSSPPPPPPSLESGIFFTWIIDQHGHRRLFFSSFSLCFLCGARWRFRNERCCLLSDSQVPSVVADCDWCSTALCAGRSLILFWTVLRQMNATVWPRDPTHLNHFPIHLLLLLLLLEDRLLNYISISIMEVYYEKAIASSFSKSF